MMMMMITAGSAVPCDITATDNTSGTTDLDFTDNYARTRVIWDVITGFSDHQLNIASCIGWEFEFYEFKKNYIYEFTQILKCHRILKR